MTAQHGIASLLILLAGLLIGLSLILGFGIINLSEKTLFTSSGEKKVEIFYEKIPGSKFHSPDGTWWGYNQNKIVRSGDFVFMYVIENADDSNKTVSDFVIYKKEGDKAWEKGAAFITSRPGNILLDEKGVLHAFVFEPVNVVKNDSWGKLKHYWFPESPKGDVINFQEETVVDNDGTNETVNIRVGAAAGEDGTLTVAFGIGRFNAIYKDFSVNVYLKKPHDEGWTHVVAGEDLGYEYYYPFVWVEDEEIHLLLVQDDWNGAGTPELPYPNVYQKIMYLRFINGEWRRDVVADLSNHTLAKTRPRLLEQEELFIDSQGKTHILYKEFLDEKNTWKATHKYITQNGPVLKEEELAVEKNNINWIRMFSVNGELFYLYVFYDSAYIKKQGSDNFVKLDIPDLRNTYPYVATQRGGTKDTEEYIDILLLAADSKDFESGINTNYYVRIPKDFFKKI